MANGNLFAQPQQERGTMSTLSRALQGFGAGVQGQGQQFLANLQAQDQALDEQRQRAMVQDAMGVHELLNSGRFDDAIGLIDKRVELINQLGGDPTDTVELRQLITTGRVPEAIGELQSFLTAPEVRPFLPEMPQDTVLKSSEVVDGQVITRSPTGEVRAQQVQGFQAPPSERVKPYTSIGQARADLESGAITPEEFTRLTEEAATEPESDSRMRKVEDFMQTFGMSRQDAIRAVESRAMMDDRGNLVRFDPVTGEGSLIDVDVGEAPAPIPAPPRATREQLSFDPGEGTGFGSSFLQLWNSTLGQLPLVPIARGPEEAAQNLRILERDAISALASSSRPAVVEQNRIIQALPRASEWTENPEIARDKMLSFIDLMTNQYVADLRGARDRRNPRSIREELDRRSKEVERVIGRVLTEDAANQMFESINRVEGEVGDLQEMSDEELLNMNPAQMTDAQLDAYINRLSGGQ